MSTISQLAALVLADAQEAYAATKQANIDRDTADKVAKAAIKTAYETWETSSIAAEVAAGEERQTQITAYQAKCIDTRNKMNEEGFGVALDAVGEFAEAIKAWSDTHNSELGAIVLQEDGDLADFYKEVGTTSDAQSGFTAGLGDGWYDAEEEAAEGETLAKGEFIPGPAAEVEAEGGEG
jgi:hypothetical protein